MKLFLILPLPQEENVICPSSERRPQCICVFLWLVEPKCYHQEAVWFKLYSLTWLTSVSQLQNRDISINTVGLERALSEVTCKYLHTVKTPNHHQSHPILPLSWTKRSLQIGICLNF